MLSASIEYHQGFGKRAGRFFHQFWPQWEVSSHCLIYWWPGRGSQTWEDGATWGRWSGRPAGGRRGGQPSGRWAGQTTPEKKAGKAMRGKETFVMMVILWKSITTISSQKAIGSITRQWAGLPKLPIVVCAAWSFTEYTILPTKDPLKNMWDDAFFCALFWYFTLFSPIML